ncbi:RNA recognition motif domain-containing protein [Desulfothermus sp.]
MKNLYVGNIPYSAREEQVMELFSEYGEVQSFNLIRDRETGRSRGFGFVEMDTEGAKRAIEGLNGKELDGRRLRVNEARSRR